MVTAQVIQTPFHIGQGFFLTHIGVSAPIRCSRCLYCDTVKITVTVITMVVFIIFSTQSVAQFLKWLRKKSIYFNQQICQGIIDARQCLFEETLFNKTFDEEINLDDECLRLTLITALTLAKKIFVNHRYVQLLQRSQVATARVIAHELIHINRACVYSLSVLSVR